MNTFAVEMLTETVSSETSSSSDEDVYIRTKKTREEVFKIKLYVENIVASYSNNVFKQHFRMKREIAYKIIDRLEHTNYLPKYRCGKTNISGEKGLLLTLWYLGNTESFRQISDRFDISLSAAHRTLLNVIKFILSLRQEYIKWPSQEESSISANTFKQKTNIDGVIGAIDGCHIKINCPYHDQDSYINRKGVHSIILQGVVNHRKVFIDVYCGEPGSLHDARVLRKSSLYVKATENPNKFNNKFIIGDSAYPSLDWLVPPFRDNGALTEEHRLFNYRHSTGRIIVEHAFGLLKGRFRRMQFFQNINICSIVQCSMACCVLHNICLKDNDDSTIVIPNISDDLQSEHHSINTTFSSRGRREEIFREMFAMK